MRQHHVLFTTTPDNCKKTLYDDLLSLLSSAGVIRVVLSVSYLLVSYFVVNFLKRIFSVCHSFRSICQSDRKVSKGVSKWKVKVLGADRISMHFEPFGERKILRVLNELQVGKEKPVMGNIEPL